MVQCEICGEEFKNPQGLAGHMKFKHPEGGDTPGEERHLTPVTKSLPAEAMVQELVIPEMVDGSRVIFDAGVQYGIRSIIIGVKIAQELSRMGIEQAMPIIKMAQEMRQAEGQAAQTAAKEAAEETAARVAQYFDQKKPDIATVPNPMAGMMARLMEATMMPMMQKMIAAVLGGQGAVSGGQAGGQAVSQTPSGWTYKEE